MKSKARTTSVVVLLALFFCPTLPAHDLPAQLPQPQSPAEAWNVIEESMANVDTLMQQVLLRDITFQIANAGSAIQYLGAQPAGATDPATVKALSSRLLTSAGDFIAAVRDRAQPFPTLRQNWLDWRKMLVELEAQYPPGTVHAAVYICPMHPLDRHTNADERCSICSMHLVRRHLPASSVYQKPGEPTMKMSVAAPPLVVGQPATVTIRLAKSDNRSVDLADLIETHTRKIHLLINDRSLSDYHHEHPEPTGTPGEYRFTFTPRRPGAYRVWADVVPAATGVGEYVIADIPAETAPAALTDRQPTTTTTVNGRTYALSLETNGQPIHAGQVVVGTITVTGSDGKPFARLEPLMGAFAHLVGFNEDLKTIIHIHPYTDQPASANARGGPAFAFKLYAPTAGFYRFYAQTRVNGASEFAAFGLAVLPAETALTPP